jgi:hypothetical protein
MRRHVYSNVISKKTPGVEGLRSAPCLQHRHRSQHTAERLASAPLDGYFLSIATAHLQGLSSGCSHRGGSWCGRCEGAPAVNAALQSERAGEVVKVGEATARRRLERADAGVNLGRRVSHGRGSYLVVSAAAKGRFQGSARRVNRMKMLCSGPKRRRGSWDRVQVRAAALRCEVRTESIKLSRL